jgi:hypothetical protein
MYVPVSDDGRQFYSQGFVVRFFKSDGSDWVANFELGLGGLSGVYELSDKPDTFVVFANGTCYFMTPDNTKPIKTINSGFQQLLFSDRHQLILLDSIDVTVIETDGQHWNSERISFDGFKDIKLDGNILSGLSFDPMDRNNEWIKFTFNITTKEITGGSYRRYEFTPVGENVSSMKLKNEIDKPWWKIW